MAEEFYIPQLGQTVEEVTLIRWLVEDGAKVKVGQEIIEVQTDKTVFPVEANADGYLHIGPYKEGDVVPVLTVVAIIGGPRDKFVLQTKELAEQPMVKSPAPILETSAAANAAVRKTSPAVLPREGRVFTSPRARKLAQEKEVDLSIVTPTGWGDLRVREQDVLAYLSQAPKVSPVAQKIADESQRKMSSERSALCPRHCLTWECWSGCLWRASGA